MKKTFCLFGLIVLTLLSACAPATPAASSTLTLPPAVPTATLPAPSATLPAPSATAPAQPLSLSEQALINGEYTAPVSGRTVRLVNGRYEVGSGDTYLLLTLLPFLAYGDLNADGVEDAAVLLAENNGGSGTFVGVAAVLNRDGVAQQVGFAPLVDDRPKVNALAIQNGRIVLDALIHGPNDPMVAPSLPVIQTYAVPPAGPLLVGMTSRIAGGQTRSIEITAPAAGDKVAGPLRVTGSMPIAPFENTLAYRITDQSGAVLAQGPFMVQANEPGGPATFDNTLDLPTLPSGTVFRVFLQEADMSGTIAFISLASVELVAK